MKQNKLKITDIYDFVKLQSEWELLPDGANFYRLIEALYYLIQLIISDMDTNGEIRFLFPLSNDKGSMSIQFFMDKTGGYYTKNKKLNLDEVIHEFILQIRDKYISDPSFKISSKSFIRSGLAMRANSMLKSMYRKIDRYVCANVDYDDIAFTHMDDIENKLDCKQEIEQLWFHYIDSPHSKDEWHHLKGFSLRHCYVALRSQSGATMVDIAKEIGVNPSRLTHLKKEFIDFYPQFDQGGFIPLPDFIGIHFSVDCVKKLGLGDELRRDILRKFKSREDLEWIMIRKSILWAAYSTAIKDHFQIDNLKNATRIEQASYWDKKTISLLVNIKNDSVSGTWLELINYQYNKNEKI
ncbi:MAG: hypothetical protein JXB49_08930 [Bacteroidales bacterium]|nr:hypothetical protein [Bacteroidales bacterium]